MKRLVPAVVVVFAVSCGCWGARHERAGYAGTADKIKLAQGAGAVALFAVGVLANPMAIGFGVDAEEMEERVAQARVLLGVGTVLLISSEAYDVWHKPTGRTTDPEARRQALEAIERLRAEHPEVSKALGRPEALQKWAPAALKRQELVYRRLVEYRERSRGFRRGELIGGVSLLIAGGTLLGPQGHSSSDDPLFYVGAGLAGTGLGMVLHRELLLKRHGTPRHTQFFLAPNGCALAYRF